MDEKKYAAFISYRHGGADEECAKLLHQYLESYRFPKQLKNKLGKNKIGRIFRDVDELPTSDSLFDNIETALGESEFLIVVCTPRLRESRWCMREIEVFAEKFGQDRILAVLAEGEPEDSFPEILTHRLVNGVMTEVEPLAADMRGDSFAQRKKKIKTERLRMLAAMTGCEYDQLFQRERRRRTKRITAVVAGVFAVIVCFTAVMIRENLKLQSQVSLTQEAQSYLLTQYSESAYLGDDRTTAALLAMEGLPENLGDSRPYVPESLAALTNALQVYNYQSGYKTDRTIKTQTMDSVCISADGKYVAYVDLADWSDFNAHIYDTEKNKVMADYDINSNVCGSQTSAVKTLFFNSHFFAGAGEDGIFVIDTDTMKKAWSGASATEVDISRDENVLAACDSDSGVATFYKADGTEISSFTAESGRLSSGGFSDDGKYFAVVCASEDDMSEMKIIEVSSGKVLYTFDKKEHQNTGNSNSWNGNTFMFKYSDEAGECQKYGYFDAESGKIEYKGKIGTANILYFDKDSVYIYDATSVKKLSLDSGETEGDYQAGGEISYVCVTDRENMKLEIALTDGTLEYVDFGGEPYCISSLKGNGEAFTKITTGGKFLAGYLMNSYQVNLYTLNEKTTEKSSHFERDPSENIATVSCVNSSFCLNTSINSYVINSESLDVTTIKSPTSYLIMANENTIMLDNYDGTYSMLDVKTGKEKCKMPDNLKFMADYAYKLDEDKDILEAYDYDTGELVKTVEVPAECSYASIFCGGLLYSIQKDGEKDSFISYSDSKGKELFSTRVDTISDFETGFVYRETNSDESVVYDCINKKEVGRYNFGLVDWIKRTDDENYLFVSTIDNGGFIIDLNSGEITITLTDSSSFYDVVSKGKDYISVLYLADNGSTMLHIYDKHNSSSPMAKIAGGLIINEKNEVLIYDGEQTIYAAPVQTKEKIYEQGKDFVEGKSLSDREKELYHCK